MGVHEIYSPQYYDTEKTALGAVESRHSDTYKTVDRVETSADESYKYVVGIEEQGRTDTFKSVQGEPGAVPAYYNGQADGDATPRDNRICGMRRKVALWVAVAAIAALLVLIGGLVGGLVHQNAVNAESKNLQKVNGTQSAANDTAPDAGTTTKKDVLMLPGTDISAVDRGEDTLLFYQYGDGKIVALACSHSEDSFKDGGATDCRSTNDTGIADAKKLSPLSATHTPAGTYLFYLNSDNQVQGGVMSAGGKYTADTDLCSLGPQTHNESRLSATWSMKDGDTGTVKLYYQDADSKIQEIYLVSDGSGWSTGPTLSEAALGSKIVALAWENWNKLNESQPGQVYQVRVYFEQANNTFLENVWDQASGWSIGQAPQRALQPNTGLTGLGWFEAGFTSAQVHIFSSDKLKDLFEFQITLPPTNTFGTLLANEEAASTTYPIAASYYLESNTTEAVNASMRVYFQQPSADGQKAIGEVMWSDSHGNGTWKAGKGIALKSI